MLSMVSINSSCTTHLMSMLEKIVLLVTSVRDTHACDQALYSLYATQHRISHTGTTCDKNPKVKSKILAIYGETLITNKRMRLNTEITYSHMLVCKNVDHDRVRTTLATGDNIGSPQLKLDATFWSNFVMCHSEIYLDVHMHVL